MPQFRTAGTQASYGVGHGFYNGAGLTSLIYCPQYITQFIRIQAGLGTDHFVGAGLNININNTRFTFQYGNAFMGEGNQGWVGAGGALYMRNPNLSARRLSYSTTKNTYTVAGTDVRRGPSQGNIWVTKNGIYNLYVPGAVWLDLKTQNASRAFWKKVHDAIDPTIADIRNSANEARDRRYDTKNQALYGTTNGLPSTRKGRKRLLEGLSLTETVNAAGLNSVGNGEIPRSKLLAVNNDIKTVITGIPPSSLFANPEFKGKNFAKLLADGLVPFGEGARVEYGKVWVNNTDCFVCNLAPFPTADHVAGPGQCETSDLCGGDTIAETFLSAQDNAKSFDVTNFPGLSLVPIGQKDEKLDLPNALVQTYELTLYCESTDPKVQTAALDGPCVTDEYLKNLLRAYTLPGYEADYGIATAPQGIHKAVSALDEDGSLHASLEIAPLDGVQAGSCQGFTKYNIYLTTEQQDVNDLLTQEWTDLIKNSTDLTTTLAENVGPSAKLKPCFVKIVGKTQGVVPTPENMPDYKPSVNNIVGPSISVGKANSIVPVTDVDAGQPVKLYVQNFPKNVAISIRLADGTTENGLIVAKIPTFEDDGFVELDWTPAADVKPGKYYLVAYQDNFPALFANSQAFDIDAPHMATN
jgi:hypothetical protein